MDLTVVSAAGFTAIGFMAGMLVTERLWWLLSRPLPRPWRAVGRAYRDLWRKTMWYIDDFVRRWDARHPAN